MSKTGRPPKNPALRASKASSTEQAGKKILLPDAPEKPRGLKGIASEVWDQLIPHLSRIGTLQRCDSLQLELYCKAYARYREAELEIENSGMFYTTEGRQGSHRKLNPAVGVQERASKEMKSLAEQFGMTTASRKNMGYDPSQLFLPFEQKSESVKDPTAALLN